MRRIYHWAILCAALALAALFSVSPAQAVLVNWNIDSSQSYVRLNFPDQNITYEGIQVSTRLRNQNSNASWTDAGGRRATVQGIIATEMSGGTIQFLGNSGSAIEDKTLRPNPAVFDPNVTSTANPNGTFISTAGSPAAYGGRLNVNALNLTNQTAGFFSISDVNYSTTSGAVPLTGGAGTYTIPGGTSAFGFQNAVFGLDGQTLSFLGQVNVPDMLISATLSGPNSAASTITPYFFGSKLTYNINVPVSLDLGLDAPIQGSLTGVLIAYAIPEPSTWALAAMGMAAMGWMARRPR